MKNKKSVAISLSIFLSFVALNVAFVSADEIQIAEAYIYTISSESEKVAITTDGRYEVTWDISDEVNINDGAVWFKVTSHNLKYPLGIVDDVTLNIEEIWVDNVKVESSIVNEPKNIFVSESYYIWGENADDYVAEFNFVLRNVDYDNIMTEIQDNIRVVFSLSNLTNPESFDSTVEASESETESTTKNNLTFETSTAAERVTEDNTTMVTTEFYPASINSNTDTNVNKDKHDSPQTGDKGICGLVVSTLSLCGIALAFRKKEVYE